MAGSIRTIVDLTYAYVRSLMHYRTLGRTAYAFFSGFFTLLFRAATYVSAQEMKELKEKNPTAWNDERARRRLYLMTLIGIDLVSLIFLWIAKYNYTLPGDFQRFGPLLWVIGHISLFIWVGRQEPILNRVQTKRMAGEELLRTVADEMTLTAKARADGAATEIFIPPHSLKNTKGYEFTWRIHQQGNPEPLLTKVPMLCHKLHKGNGQIFTYQDKNDNSLVRATVLAKNPWDSPPSRHPLILKPRRFNVWKEAADLGLCPDFSEWMKILISEGDGGGILIAGAPRKGKTIFIKDILIYLMMDPVNNIHMIDGKSLDFPDIIPLCSSYVGEKEMDDIALLRAATALLEGMKEEIYRRKNLLRAEKAQHVTEELCKRLKLQLEWIIIDELAVITEDMRTLHKDDVTYFIDLLQYIVRMGPAFGIFCILATQRPSAVSVPDSIRSLISFRIAFYISSQAGSYAILGKAGPQYRADWLDPEQKGVGLSVGDGQIRPHFVTPSDFTMAVDFSIALRAGEGLPDESTHEYPKLVKDVIQVFESENTTRLYTSTIIEALVELGTKHDSASLASALKPFGISSKNVTIGGKELKGYRKEDLENAPKMARRLPSAGVGTTAVDGEPLWVATTEDSEPDA